MVVVPVVVAQEPLAITVSQQMERLIPLEVVEQAFNAICQELVRFRRQEPPTERIIGAVAGVAVEQEQMDSEEMVGWGVVEGDPHFNPELLVEPRAGPH